MSDPMSDRQMKRRLQPLEALTHQASRDFSWPRWGPRLGHVTVPHQWLHKQHDGCRGAKGAWQTEPS
jgi:hypothetical protein